MKCLQITLFIIIFLSLLTQFFRHGYTKWIAPKGSILEKCKEGVDKKIEALKTLKELEKYYKDTIKEDQEKKKNKPNYYNRDIHKITTKIREMESINKQISELYFFWGCGLFTVILGIILYINFQKWIGIASIITGFFEMMSTTFPTYRYFGRHSNFDSLVTGKLFLSLISFCLLLILWFQKNKYEENKE